MAAPLRPTRLLLAYANQQEALSHLVHSENPDQAALAAVVSRWETALRRLAALGERPPEDPNIEALPPDLARRADQVKTDPSFDFLLANVNPEFGMLNIGRLISVQKMVYADERRDIEALDPNDVDGLLTVTVPQPTLRRQGVVQDQSTLSFTLASDNPNLRIGGMTQAQISAATPSGAQLPLQIYGFFVTYGGPWMQAAHFRGRWFLRDGYHRAYALLRRGIDRVPCVIVRPNTLEELGFVRPGFVGTDVLLGDRPPRVADFCDDSLAVNGSQISIRKVVRIKAEEFVIASGD